MYIMHIYIYIHIRIYIYIYIYIYICIRSADQPQSGCRSTRRMGRTRGARKGRRDVTGLAGRLRQCSPSDSSNRLARQSASNSNHANNQQ